MRTFVFASRNTKEILRDMITLFFGLGFPLVLMVLLSAINASIPQEAAELVTYHIFSNIYRNVLTTVVNGECVTNELRENC